MSTTSPTQPGPDGIGAGPGEPASSDPPIGTRLDQLDRKEGQLWRISLLFLTLLAIATAGSTWEMLRTLPQRLAALPVGVVILVVLFVAYVWAKKREISELRGYVRGLTERATAPASEQQLQELIDVVAKSQEKYRELVDSLEDLVFTLSLDGEVRAANRRLAELLGTRIQGLIGQRLDKYLDEPRREDVLRGIPTFLDERHWTGTVLVRLAGSGRALYFEIVLRAIVKDGTVTGVSGRGRDVTHLREAEARFTGLFETLQEGVYFSTPEGKLLDANPALVRMLGYRSRVELLGVNVNDLYVEPQERHELVRELEQGALIRNREIVLRKKDGSQVICLDSSTAFRDASGRVARYQGTLVDVTQRVEMEKRLHAEQEFARRLVASFPDLIVVLDAEGRYTFVSPNIKELLGYTPEDLLGHKLGERSDPESRVAMVELHRDVISGKIATPAVIEYRTRHKNGNWRVFRASVSALHDPQGRVTGVVASSRDVSDVKRLEQQVIQSERLAAMGQMIAGVAHELNNPLTAILGISDLLHERATDDAMRRQVDLVHKQARRTADIVKNLLVFSRPPAAGKTPLNLLEVVRSTLQLHEHSLRKSNIAVIIPPVPELPPVLGDANQLMQVFMNLILNAEQAIREARDRGSITIRFGRPALKPGAGPQVSVSFQDDGPGIPPDVAAKVFEPFFTTKRPGGGTGLGLSICLAILREHAGEIRTEPAPGGGTVFTVTFPVARDVEAPSAPAAPARETISLAGKQVLVVDDEAGIRELVEAGLSARGAEVRKAAGGDEATAILTAAESAGRSLDAVLCDLKMPSMTGMELYERLRARPTPVRPKFIVMSGDILDPATLERFRAEGVPVIQKPFRVSDLVALLDRELGKSGKR